jgi:hypothetical protein
MKALLAALVCGRRDKPSIGRPVPRQHGAHAPAKLPVNEFEIQFQVG